MNVLNFKYVNNCDSSEHFRKENHTAEVYGKQTSAGPVCHAATRGPVCGELGWWLGFPGSYEVSRDVLVKLQPLKH